MYIPPFICGFIIGVVVAAVTIIIWAMQYDKRDKDEDEE